jgi:uncharacterized protein (DUF1800 family)
MVFTGVFRGRAAGLIGACACLALSSAWAQAPSHWPDVNFHDGFDGLSGAPASDADASRFLAQATFGATDQSIAHLRQIGYQAWLDEQFAAPASTQVPYFDWISHLVCPPDNQNCNSVDDDVRLEIWAINAVGSPDPSRSGRIAADQLRQRVAFALSELFVVSNSNGTLAYEPWALASFYDMLAADAFANYRVVLEDVTKHPAMGIFLSSIQNRKADPTQNVHPDENYAREINQLFSVGLIQLNADGTPVLSGGHAIPTYDQTVVRGFAAVFTGWNWNSSPQSGCGNNSFNCCDEDTYFYCGPSNYDDMPWRLPMQPVEAYHDNTSDKQLLDYPGVALAGGVLVHGGDAQTELSAALDNIFHHPNVGPFVVTRLIQRLVTSNPTPAYVKRVAQVFDDDGSAAHVRGSLKAVVRAILLDPEARYGPWQRPDTFGKLREPMIKITQMWRAMGATSVSGRVGSINPYPPIEQQIGQAPLRSPTVFNFFKPDFAPPGEMRTRGLLGPEFQILSDTMTVSTPNYLFHEIFCDYVGSQRCYASDSPQTMRLDEDRDAALALTDPGALIDRYSLLLMGGQMSPFMRSVLLTRLNALNDNSNGDLGRQRVQHALYLIFNSPEYSVQK